LALKETLKSLIICDVHPQIDPGEGYLLVRCASRRVTRTPGCSSRNLPLEDALQLVRLCLE